MSANRSENHHYRRGDVTLLVDGILFKLHRDVLESHSDYFRNSLDRAESSDEKARSSEKPVVLSSDICTADSFEMICHFLYPRSIGVFPDILVKDLDVWDSVLRATIALGMSGLRRHILSRFEEDITGVSAAAAKLLGLIMSYEETPDPLKLHCLQSLIYLRRPLSALEVGALGAQATAQVVAIRDRIRILITTSPPYWMTIQRHYLCDGVNCQQFLHEGIFNNIKDMDPLNELYQSDSSIFDLSQDNRICGYCNSIRGTLARTMAKQELETEIQRCAIGLGLLKVGEEGSK